MGGRKGGRILVGFAMETENETENAREKLRRKKFSNFVALNSLRTAGAGFRGDTNVLSLIDASSREDLPLMSKREAADRIVDKIENCINGQNR